MRVTKLSPVASLLVLVGDTQNTLVNIRSAGIRLMHLRGDKHARAVLDEPQRTTKSDSVIQENIVLGNCDM